MDFLNKVVLVTGASAGIGEAIAEEFARRGARLALVGRNQGNLAAVAGRCREIQGKDVLPIVADIATDEGCEKVAKETMDHFNRLDVLVNNAGVGGRDLLPTANMAIFDRVFATNVRAPYNLTRLLTAALIASKGNIVNISSTSATMVYVGTIPYSMSKAAVDHFTQLAALELAPHGIRVNSVSPGLTVSTFHMRLTGSSEEEYRQWIRRVQHAVPLGRACVGADIAKMVAHIASDASSMVTGTIVPVDGGLRFNASGITNALDQPKQN